MDNVAGYDVSSGTIKLRAPAKVNLTLHVLRRRADGYHELLTRMQKLDLSDEITLVARNQPGISLTCRANGVPEDESNLAWKAAAAFLKEMSTTNRYGVDIGLVKKIPVAAGLGGGSSDAGTILKGLNILFKAGYSEQQLVEMAKPLGADVPFFATDYNAVVATGIGEKMTAVESLAGCRLILINPGFFVSAGWAYENYTLTRAGKTFKKICFQKTIDKAFQCSDLHNDLEDVTVKHYPIIAEIKNELRDAGATGVLMSGSGPTVFGIFCNSGRIGGYELDGLAAGLRSRYGDNVFVTSVNGKTDVSLLK